MRHFADSFALFAEGQEVVRALLDTCGEFSHLERASLVCITSQRALVERGRAMPAVVAQPESDARSSAKRSLYDWLIAEFVRPRCDGHEPDFLLLFDTALWPEASLDREHLVYHLLCHVEQTEDEYGAPQFHRDGRPRLRLRAHDIERFHAEIARYGSVVQGIADERGVYAATRLRELKLA